MDEQIVLCTTKMGTKDLHGCFQAREASQEADPFHEGLSQQGKKLQKDRLNTGSWSDKSFFFLIRPTLPLK